ncbi:uncharacterized protein METZ01_LOCUS469055 [marine metagenome]|uniref:Disulfide bond formation protein B n=1 Tax=marine metagenome TaxID=408172 RepID=A0A383B8M9_9ZZZZ
MANVKLYPFLSQPQFIFATLGIVSAFSVGFAFYLQLFQDLPPCVLCQYQRLPYLAIITIASLGILASRNAKYCKLTVSMATLCALTFFIGSMTALFHLGVEMEWWKGTAGCGVTGLNATSVETLKDTIMKSPLTNCGDVLWRYLGISLAGWNLLWSTSLAIVSAIFARLWTKNTKHA